jgi:putative membrane protein (TIGR04086 family)
VSRLNVPAILAGAGVALAVIVPVVVIARLLVDDAGTTARYLFGGLILASTMGGAIVTGRLERSTPFLHGALTGLSIFVVAQLVSSAVAASIPNPVALVFFALVFMSLGTIGGFIAGFVGPKGSGSMQERSP